MSTPEEMFEELNFPSVQKLKKVLDSRGISYEKKEIEKLVRREAVRQVQAPAQNLIDKLERMASMTNGFVI